jgi:hypothetical protein
MFFVIVLLWLGLFLFLLSTRTELKLFPVASVVVGGALIAAMIDLSRADADRTAAMKAGTFDCRAPVAANDYEVYTRRHDVWAYCSGVFGGAGRWQAFLKAADERRAAEDAKREAE